MFNSNLVQVLKWQLNISCGKFPKYPFIDGFIKRFIGREWKKKHFKNNLDLKDAGWPKILKKNNESLDKILLNIGMNTFQIFQGSW